MYIEKVYNLYLYYTFPYYCFGTPKGESLFAAKAQSFFLLTLMFCFHSIHANNVLWLEIAPKNLFVYHKKKGLSWGN